MVSLFSGAKNVLITGGTFTSVNQPTNSIRYGMDCLLENISRGAFHNAAERGTPPRCHPHTRQAIRAEIMEWISAPSSMRKLILWMYGPAGAGKTAIAQSIAEECEQQGLIAASFFFWRTAAGRNDASKFVATLAYQLSRYVSQLEDPILTAIEQDPAIFSRSVSTQMHFLVIAPLKSVRPILSTPLFVIVDGFDECGPDGQAQSDLLHLLGTVALELQEIPLIFLIASRPEYEIREAFNSDFLNPLIKVLVLDNSYKPDEDINIFLQSTFQKIHEEHSKLGRRLPSPWPTANDIGSLVSKASGQFIFAATVLKFIDSPRHNPVDRLNVILRFSAVGKETPFTLLDTLYRFILDSVVDVEKVLEILTFLLLEKHYGGPFTLHQAEDLLGFEFHSILLDMHSLLFISDPAENKLPTMYHASLSDFLTDRSRSRNHYIDIHQGHIRLCHRWLKVIGTNGQFRILEKRFAVSAFIQGCEKFAVGKDILDDLACLDLRTSLEDTPNVDMDLYYVDWTRFFACLQQQAGDRDDIFPRLQNDFDTFLLNRIAQYPLSLQNHVATLLCVESYSIAPYIFEILVRGEDLSKEELKKFHQLDARLFGILADVSLFNTCFGKVMQDEARAGKYFVDGDSYAALVYSLLKITYTKTPGRRDDWELWTYGKPESIHAFGGWFAEMLDKASINLELAYFLRKRVFRFQPGMKPIVHMAEASIRYLQKCGIPFLVHPQWEDMHECGIGCHWCLGASVVESLKLTGLEAIYKPTIKPVVHDPGAGLSPRKKLRLLYEYIPMNLRFDTT